MTRWLHWTASWCTRHWLEEVDNATLEWVASRQFKQARKQTQTTKRLTPRRSGPPSHTAEPVNEFETPGGLSLLSDVP